MKQKLIFSVWMSGSCKSYFGNILKKEYNYKVVCPDDLRYDLYGNINDMSHEETIWQESYKLVHNYLNEGGNVYFSATCLKPLQQVFPVLWLVNNLNIPVHFFFFSDSENFSLCQERVRKDISEHKLRSNVPDEVLENQHSRYMNLVKPESKKDIIDKLAYKDVTAIITEDTDPYTKFLDIVNVNFV